MSRASLYALSIHTLMPTLCFLALVCPAHAEMSEESRARLGVSVEAERDLIEVATSPDLGYAPEAALKNAPDILSLAACHAGGSRLLFRISFAAPPSYRTAQFILYADLDNDPATGRQDNPQVRGTDVMVILSNDAVSLSLYGAAFTPQTTQARAVVEGPDLFIALDAPFNRAEGQAVFPVQLLSELRGGRADSIGATLLRLPLSDRQVPVVPAKVGLSLRPLSEYRYHDSLIKLEKLSDKGLTRQDVTPAQPMTRPRPRPEPPFAAQARQPGRAGSADYEQVRVELLEEAGVARRATPVTFGFPFPQGAVFDPAHVRVVVGGGGAEIPAQVTPTAFWPDDSLKWALVDLQVPLSAGERRVCIVEFGSHVPHAAAESPLQVQDDADGIVVTTGPLRARVDKRQFNVLRSVQRDGNGDGVFSAGETVLACSPEGLRLVDEQGRVFTSANVPPDSIKIEEAGPQKVVVCVEGHYGYPDGTTYMAYAARLTFRAGSSRIDLALSHTDDHLMTEFSDIRSLTLPLAPVGGISQCAVYVPGTDGKLQAHVCQSARLLQKDERSFSLQADGAETQGKQAPGILRCEGPTGPFTVAVHDFWQRWPKGFTYSAPQLSVDLLPIQPSADYGKDLPGYLMYPFVEGMYRLKWGMSFTERVTLDLDPTAQPEEVAAEATLPVVAVVPAEWYAKTGALGPLAAPLARQFGVWDDFVARSHDAYVASRDNTREYGFFNYGDWYGERGRNWGNNEYDLAHGFFMQFARTGDRRYFRLALTAARHQADVDCIHAYPDPYYVGGNHLHSVGHTGAWSERPEHGVWSWRYDYHSSAASGHVWADGMMDAWYLTGEPRIVEAALGLGEHIAWGMSQDFKALGTHERSAGWSLRAIMAIYRGTYDPVYLEAARRIVAVALREQKFDQGGAWPHVLPLDHAGGHPGAVGNNLFLIGILLGGLQAYHAETGDPAVLRSLQSGVDWVLKSWDASASGWPYSASPTGEPFYTPSTSLNALIISPVAYVGLQTGNDQMLQVAEEALSALAFQGSDAFGKSAAQKMFFTSDTLALLQQWYAQRHADKGATALDGGPEWLAGRLAATPDAREHSVRAPNRKLFFVQLKGEQAELTITRRPHGAMNKGAEFATVRVLGPGEAVLGEGKCSTDDRYELRVPLVGKPGDQLRVVVDDDQRGVWTLRGEGLGIVMQTSPDFRIGGVGRSRFRFFVPEGTQEFRVGLLGVHNGPYGGIVMTPDAKVAGMAQGVNPGPALIPGAAPAGGPKGDQHPERAVITVKPAPEDTGKLWSVILWAAIDIGCDLQGVPPYLSLSEPAWFAPSPPAGGSGQG